MYEEQDMGQGPGVPLTMTWGIDNPLLNMAAYMGVSLGARALGKGLNAPRRFGGRPLVRSPMSSVMRAQMAGQIPAGSHRALNDLQKKYGPKRWMSHVTTQDIYGGRLPKGTAYTKGAKGFFGRRVANNQLLMRGLTQKFGAGMAGRVAGYRALSSLLHITNLSFAGYLGSQLLGAAGDMVANWRPAQSINPRRQLETGGPIIDTAAAMTMRSRALQAIHNSQIGTRAALGNEASFFHHDGG